MFHRRYESLSGEFQMWRAILDLVTILMVCFILIDALMVLIIDQENEEEVLSDEPKALNAMRPTGAALRTQVSWDANYLRQITLNETCKTPQDVGFAPHVRPQECSTADVDLWIVRVEKNGNQLFYSARGQADKLFSSTLDDKGFERNDQETLFRYEQLVAQFGLLPPGTYHIVVDLFQPDIYLPTRNVKVCGTALYREGEPEYQLELFNGCVEVSIGGSAPQTVTVVSFEVDDNNNVARSSVRYGDPFSLETGFYGK